MDFVLDASITLSWCFEDESTESSARILDHLERSTAFVPSIWNLEVGNILVNAGRKKRITKAKIAEFIELLEELNIQIDHETSARGFHEILALATEEKITTYDAAYLELAMRLGLPLATKDIQLQNAAKKIGVKIL